MNTSASSSTLWATASKEWVIQPKPKPGRKPKKDAPVNSKDDTEPDIKGRRIQNRAAQRAFRERKQSQLSELQARIQSYEQGEIERNVALQNIAKRLKEDNEKLRKENLTLQEKLAEIQNKNNLSSSSQTSSQLEKKRWREDSPNTCLQPSQNKKSRMDSQQPQYSASSATHLPSPSSMVSTPDSNDTTDNHFSTNYDTHSDLNHSSFETFAHLTSDVKADHLLRPFPSLGCGFCDGSAICLCHEISVQDVVERATEITELKPTQYNGNQMSINDAQDTTNSSNPQASILDNLPAYQPPIPLKRRTGGALVNSVFPITAIGESSNTSATCSGDPSNCAACGDDAFGKAFCAAIGNTDSNNCDDCPAQTNLLGGLGCCGNGSCDNCPSTRPSTLKFPTEIARPQFPPATSEYIPTSDAWKRLKAHPNVEFADLSLLAEVVASRSKCLGPQFTAVPSTSIEHTNNATGRFRDPPAFSYQRHASPPLQLVPQEVLLECGRRRMRHVHADGVKDALRLLDAKFS